MVFWRYTTSAVMCLSPPSVSRVNALPGVMPRTFRSRENHEWCVIPSTSVLAEGLVLG